MQAGLQEGAAGYFTVIPLPLPLLDREGLSSHTCLTSHFPSHHPNYKIYPLLSRYWFVSLCPPLTSPLPLYLPTLPQSPLAHLLCDWWTPLNLSLFFKHFSCLQPECNLPVPGTLHLVTTWGRGCLFSGIPAVRRWGVPLAHQCHLSLFFCPPVKPFCCS